jgi:hypothetical protein
MPVFIDSAIRARNKARKNYETSQQESAIAVNHAKVTLKLFAARPETLLACFGVGAYKGATTDSPPSRRRQAVMTYARTALIKLLG